MWVLGLVAFTLAWIVLVRCVGPRHHKHRDTSKHGGPRIRTLPYAAGIVIFTHRGTRTIQRWGAKHRLKLYSWFAYAPQLLILCSIVATTILTANLVRVIWLCFHAWKTNSRSTTNDFDQDDAVKEVQILAASVKQPLYEAMSSASSASWLTLALPGITFPLAEVPFLWTAICIAVLFHEIGHALAAAAYGIRVRGFGFFITPLFPGAFVELGDHKELLHRHQNQPVSTTTATVTAAAAKEAQAEANQQCAVVDLNAKGAMAVAAAGVWHNLILCGVCLCTLPLIPCLFYPLYVPPGGYGPVVASTNHASTSLQRALPDWHVIHAVDGMPTPSVNEWYKQMRSVSDWNVETNSFVHPDGRCIDPIPSTLVAQCCSSGTNVEAEPLQDDGGRDHDSGDYERHRSKGATSSAAPTVQCLVWDVSPDVNNTASSVLVRQRFRQRRVQQRACMRAKDVMSSSSRMCRSTNECPGTLVCARLDGLARGERLVIIEHSSSFVWHVQSTGDVENPRERMQQRARVRSAKVGFSARNEYSLFFVGYPHELMRDLHMTNSLPRAAVKPFLQFVPLPFAVAPDLVERVLLYVVAVSLSLALINAAPIFGADGEAALMQFFLVNREHATARKVVVLASAGHERHQTGSHSVGVRRNDRQFGNCTVTVGNSRGKMKDDDVAVLDRSVAVSSLVQTHRSLQFLLLGGTGLLIGNVALTFVHLATR